VNAKAGDAVIFEFQSGNHTVTQSSFNAPCEPLADGLDSGFMPNLNSQVPFPSYTLQVNTTGPQCESQLSFWPSSTKRPLGFYSEGQGDCASGMTFGLNPNSSETEAEFQAAAIAETTVAENKSSGGTSKGVKIGVSIGVILFSLLVAAVLIAFLIHRRRKYQAAPPYDGAPPDHNAYENKPYDTENKPPVPEKNHELSASLGKNLGSSPRYELASPPVELAGSRFDHYPDPPNQGSFYRESDDPSL
jgi:hypothetical protein